VATLSLDLSYLNLTEPLGRRFYDDLLVRVRAIPGVEAAGYGARLPFGFGAGRSLVAVPGVDPPTGEAGFQIEMNRVSPGWIETVGVTLARGRGFNPEDRARLQGVLLVNQEMARRFWPGVDPVGRGLTIDGRPAEVIGVVDDRRFAVPGRATEPPRVYLSTDQIYSPRAVLLVRTTKSSREVGNRLFRAVAELNPDLPLPPAGTLQANLEVAYLPQRLLGGAAGAIALLTLLLAALGLSGLLAYWVTSRQVELGVRSALGARSSAVVALVVRQGLVPISYGVGAGLGLAIIVGLALRRFLLGVSVLDPLAYLGAMTTFYLVAILACLLPARRAARVNPMVALRS
jgi:putative ABC transport system permease protein